jgi:hypothetical protein
MNADDRKKKIGAFVIYRLSPVIFFGKIPSSYKRDISLGYPINGKDDQVLLTLSTCGGNSFLRELTISFS